MEKKKLVPWRVHSPKEFLIFIIHVMRLRIAHVDFRNKSYEREKQKQKQTNQNIEHKKHKQ